MSFRATLIQNGSVVLIKLEGELDAATAPMFRDEVRRAAQHNLDHLVVDVANVSYLSSAGLRVLAYARQKMPDRVRIVLVGANDIIRRTILLVGFQYNVEINDRFPGLESALYRPVNGEPPVV